MINIGKFHDLNGKNFGDLEVIGYDGFRGNKSYWICKCHYNNCNNISTIQSYVLTHGLQTRCGLHQHNSKQNTYNLDGEYGIGYTSNTNKEFYFDLEDYDKIREYYWRESNGYISCHKRIEGKTKMILQHRLILNCIDSKNVVDHKNGCRNDNRKENIRLTSYARNGQNRTKPASNNKTGFTGVKMVDGKYRSYLTHDGEFIDLGYYDNFETAVRARIKGEQKYFGEYAFMG